MIPHQYQAASMHTNPHLTRNIDETVQNLKNLEICIDALRNDLVQVAQSTGNVHAAQRLQTPASLAAASPWAAQSSVAPWAFQGQLGNVNPLAQTSVSTPYGATDPIAAQFSPYQSAVSPYASAFGANPAISSPYAASPIGSAAVNPWQQAEIEQMRQAELARQQAFSPWAQASPIALQSQFGVPRTQVSPYAQQSASPLAAQASFAQATPFRHAAHETTARQIPTSPFSSAATVGPF